MDRRVTSPTWGPAPPRKQALNFDWIVHIKKLCEYAYMKAEILYWGPFSQSLTKTVGEETKNNLNSLLVTRAISRLSKVTI